MKWLTVFAIVSSGVVACAHTDRQEIVAAEIVAASESNGPSKNKGLGIDSSIFASCKKNMKNGQAIWLYCPETKLRLCTKENYCSSASLLEGLADDAMAGDEKRRYLNAKTVKQVVVSFNGYFLDSRRDYFYSSEAQETGTMDYVEFKKQKDGIMSATCSADLADTALCEKILLYIGYVGLPDFDAPDLAKESTPNVDIEEKKRLEKEALKQMMGTD